MVSDPWSWNYLLNMCLILWKSSRSWLTKIHLSSSTPLFFELLLVILIKIRLVL